MRFVALENCIMMCNKRYYDRKAKQQQFKIGDQVLVRFPGEEQGKQRKLSRPWHGPYRITSRDDPDVSVVKSYFPGEGAIRIHQKRVCHCPPGFPPGYYWYGANRHSEGNLPKWVERLANDVVAVSDTSQDVLEPTNNLEAEQEAVDKFTGTHNDPAVEEDVATLFEPIEQPTRANSKYSLRDHVTPPNRLYNTSLGTSST